MLKIFLTGDNHIGLKYSSHDKAQILRERRITAFRGMVDCANREKCDLFIISGDLFDNSRVSKQDMRGVFDLLKDFNGTIALLPGNHDFCDADGEFWRDIRILSNSYHADFLILNERRPYSVSIPAGEVVLYPAFCFSKHSAPNENALGWIKEQNMERDGVFRIGIAHGAVEGETIDSEGKYYMMSRGELEKIPVDVWLIGHTHVPFPRDLSETEYRLCERILNAGTHVQTDVNCNTDGECFLIEIDEEKRVRARKFRSGNLRFYRLEVRVNAGELEEKVQSALKNIADDSVVELVLTGAVTEEEYQNRHPVFENALSRFLEGKYFDSALGCNISERRIDSLFPETSFSAKFLKALLPDPKETQLAYELLEELKNGGKRR